MKTQSEIMSASAEEVARVLVEYNKRRRGDVPYESIDVYGGRILDLYIDRAVEPLNQKGEQECAKQR